MTFSITKISPTLKQNESKKKILGQITKKYDVATKTKKVFQNLESGQILKICQMIRQRCHRTINLNQNLLSVIFTVSSSDEVLQSK